MYNIHINASVYIVPEGNEIARGIEIASAEVH